jgi:hypothetical protein
MEETMPNKILNWGILSTARINRALIPPLQISKRNHLLAVANRVWINMRKKMRIWIV